MTTRAATPSPGDVVAGKYRVERIIGEGGMGVVVAATHLQLDQLVALKFTTVEDGPAVARFLREAKSAVRLRSEHVAKVTDVGTLENGMPYMVMEYLEGKDLAAVLQERGPLTVSDAVGYVVQACEAVAEAHAIGIVHRDLKPHNLFLTTGVGGEPKVKVLDFGISKNLGADLVITKTSEIVGTPMYMSPEQLRSAKDVDLRADIWALGVILYELLTGRLPFEAENLPHLCSLVATEDPKPPSVHREDLPPALCEAILRCLRRPLAERFHDAADLALTLAPFAPDWASTQRLQRLPRSTPSGRAAPSVAPATSPSGRAIISSPSGSSANTNAAWSETEVAPGRRLWKRKIVTVPLGFTAVAVVCALLLGMRIEKHHMMQLAGNGRGPSVPAPLPAESGPTAPSPPPAAPVAAHDETAAAKAQPAGSAAPISAAAPSATTSSSHAQVHPSAPAPATKPRPKPSQPPVVAPSAQTEDNAYNSRK